MFKIPYREESGKSYEVQCSAENISLNIIRGIPKKACKFIAEKWHIYTVEGLLFLTDEDIEKIPISKGYKELKNFWNQLKTKTELHEKNFKTLDRLRDHNHRYNGEQKRALLGLSLVLPFIKKHKIPVMIPEAVPGYKHFSKEKRKIILANVA